MLCEKVQKNNRLSGKKDIKNTHDYRAKSQKSARYDRRSLRGKLTWGDVHFPEKGRNVLREGSKKQQIIRGKVLKILKTHKIQGKKVKKSARYDRRSLKGTLTWGWGGGIFLQKGRNFMKKVQKTM